MIRKNELLPKDLKAKINSKDLNFNPLDTVLDTTELIYGQERGIKSFDFGLEINVKGYNIYFEGPTGVGKTMYIRKYLSDKAEKGQTPDDWCYVYNFENPNEPLSIRLPAGQGLEFKNSMSTFISSIRTYLQNAFKEDQLEKEKELISQEFEKEKKSIIKELNLKTKPKGFEVVESSNGVFMLPVVDGITLSKDDFEKLDSKIKIEFEAKSKDIQEDIFEALAIIKELELKKDGNLKDWQRQIADRVIDKQLVPIIDQFKENIKILYFLRTVKEDVLDNLDEFLKRDFSDCPTPNQQMQQPQFKPWENYEVNLFVDNSKTKGAPVIMDINYTFENIFGKVDYENRFGTLVTDYKKIQSGLLHRANGGYIVFQAKELLSTPMAYEILKRALKVERLGIEANPEQKVPMLLVTLKPEHMPLNVKVILIGHADVYQFLLQNDEDFKKLFKIKVEFEETASKSKENIEKLSKFIASFCAQESLLPLNNEAMARVVEYASKLADDKEKLSTNFAEIGKLVAEASTWAKASKEKVITEEYVMKSFLERIERIKKYDNKLTEMIEKDLLLIDTKGSQIGQINGLSVIVFGDYAFGKPSRITANTFLGNRGIVNVEREIEMSGPSHSKGVLIISGYLGEKFAQNFPLSLTASIVFEQLYGEVDGDSASSTEIYAILSSLADLPLSQEIAVTGSVNQKGFIQPIGGVNEKIQGFYQICKIKGLTGNQGVIIPKQNIDNLHLSDEIIESVQKKEFHIYAISTIDEGIEILTGVPSGKMNANGEYPRGTVNYLVYQKLKKYSEKKGAKNNGNK